MKIELKYKYLLRMRLYIFHYLLDGGLNKPYFDSWNDYYNFYLYCLDYAKAK